MALVIPGQTKCSICGEVIRENDEVVGFPAFLSRGHRLHRFSDSVFHKRCFATCAERQEVEAVYLKWRDLWDARPRDLKSTTEIDEWVKRTFSEF